MNICSGLIINNEHLHHRGKDKHKTRNPFERNNTKFSMNNYKQEGQLLLTFTVT